jgi:hypothetical protein
MMRDAEICFEFLGCKISEKKRDTEICFQNHSQKLLASVFFLKHSSCFPREPKIWHYCPLVVRRTFGVFHHPMGKCGDF